jgi:predicted nucleic acid-binding protein
VVDASVAVKWVVPEPSSAAARALLGAGRRGEADLIAPDLFVSEVANVIWKWGRRHPEIAADAVRATLAALLRVLPELVSSESLAQQALELARTFDYPTYDCLYVALALRDEATLVTADRRLLRTLGPAFNQIIDIDDLELS